MISTVSVILAVSAIAYVAVLFGVSLWSGKRIHNTEDYLVAGRRLPLSLATGTIFATWFGAGTLLTATDEVCAEGLRAAALDPLGAGLCLIIAGIWFARPLWKMKLLTLADFYRARFGTRAEILSSLFMIPGYCGWIAAQFVALSAVMELFFGLPPHVGIALVAIIGTAYTLIGGMWSVTLTDAAQVFLLILGIVVLSLSAFGALGEGSLVDGWERFLTETPSTDLAIIPTGKSSEWVMWIGVLAAGALGNLPGQDLMQRVFASKSSGTARNACVIAGILYLVVGALPLLTGLAGTLLFPNAPEGSILPFLANQLLNPALTVIFMLGVMSAVLSTIDSAILSPASVLSQNLLLRIPQTRWDSLRLNQISVIVIGLASLVVAYLGEEAYSLLESAYELGVVGLLVPLVLGLFTRRGGERSALGSMVVGMLLWLLHLLMGWDLFLAPILAETVPLPMGLSCAALGTVSYFVLDLRTIGSQEIER